VDENNNIWVQTWEKAEDGESFVFDVFSPKGICFAQVPLKISPMSWKQGKLYGVVEDEEGYQYVVRYSVHWF
jgi:hypothetical protein